MGQDIIGIDQSQAIIDLVTQRLSEKGVLVSSEPVTGGYVLNAQGMANKRRAYIGLGVQSGQTPEQVSTSADDAVRLIEDAIRQGGETEMDSNNQNA